MSIKGYISEIFSSIQGEGGSVRGSCFGKRQIFIRMCGCNLVKGKEKGENNTAGCIWCDSPDAQQVRGKRCKYEIEPGSEKFEKIKNPLSSSDLLPRIQNLITPDLHSISFTGGEPLVQLPFLLHLAKTLRDHILHPLYLETNGTILPETEYLPKIGKWFSYCCCDIKDRSAHATTDDQWKSLVQKELKFIKSMTELGINTFAKIVVTQDTQLSDIENICKQLSSITYSTSEIVGLAIQPVSLKQHHTKQISPISKSHIYQIFQTAAGSLPPENLSLSLQTHKYLNLL